MDDVTAGKAIELQAKNHAKRLGATVVNRHKKGKNAKLNNAVNGEPESDESEESDSASDADVEAAALPSADSA